MSFNSRTLGRVRLSQRQPDVVAPYRFNSRTLGRVRLRRGRTIVLYYEVSIHAPWEGCDSCPLCVTKLRLWFQFTHPGKGATAVRTLMVVSDGVSIHAPWEGCDQIVGVFVTPIVVSIHAPWEGCDVIVSTAYSISCVSIHAPWEGCDS